MQCETQHHPVGRDPLASTMNHAFALTLSDSYILVASSLWFTATEMNAETLEQLQNTMWLNPDSQF
jgi:hypothetical protein